jgi:exopolysaccharide biosynthesis polyprenyl glycosylphosphotransferase
MSALRERVLSKEQVCSQIVACFSTDPGNSATYAPGVCRYTGVSDLRRYLSHNPADIVILGAPLESIPDADLLMASVLEIGLTVCVLPGYCSDNLLEIFQFVQLSYGFAGTHLVAIRGVVQHPAYLLTKRMFDIVVSAIALLLLSPVFFAIAIMVKLTSRGPIFYHWKVLGKNRKPFVGYKFRTMCVDADRLKEGLMKFNEMTGPVFKMRSDPRITKIGCWLRKFSLDEIPQLYSVLMGDMSLVGPRPSFKSESDCFEFWQHRKLSVKPGITCLWQISGRNKIADFSDWAKLDLQYIENASFLLDLKILLMTIPAVLFAKGAC